MGRHTLLIGAMAAAVMTSGCGRGNDDAGTRGAAGTSGTNVAGGAAMTLRGCVEAGSPAGTYILRTSGLGDERGGAAGTSGANRPDVSGTVPDQEGGQIYRLIATGNLDIGLNLGKEVAITGELARQARDNAGTVGGTGTSGSDRSRRPAGEGDAGTDLQSGSSQGSGNGRVQGAAPDHLAGARFFRVTALSRVSDRCAHLPPTSR